MTLLQAPASNYVTSLSVRISTSCVSSDAFLVRTTTTTKNKPKDASLALLTLHTPTKDAGLHTRKVNVILTGSSNPSPQAQTNSDARNKVCELTHMCDLVEETMCLNQYWLFPSSFWGIATP